MLHRNVLGDLLSIRLSHLANDACFAPADAPPPSPALLGVSDCAAQLALPAYEFLRFVTGKEPYRLMACLSSPFPSHLLDDAALVTLELETGAIATIRASKLALLHARQLSIEVDGTAGSLAWSSGSPSVRSEPGRHM